MKYLLYCLMLCLVLVSCREEEGHGPLTPGIKPPAITQHVVQNYPGAVEISYQIPDSVNTMYVLAEYEPASGKIKETKASRYRNWIRLEGFGQSGKYQVKLYAVGEDEQRSEPVVVEVEPMTPPYIEAFNSLKVGPNWGGIVASYTNVAKTDLMLEVIRKNAKGEWEVVARNASNLEDVVFTDRGHPSISTMFGFYLRDRWLNYSDTLFASITPYFEEMLDMKNKYVLTCLPTDQCVAHQTGAARHMGMLFDGSFTQQTSWYTPPGSGVPVHFTLFLGGDSYQLSRLKLWQRTGTAYSYQAANPRYFEVYGSMDPNPDGSWDSWQLMGTFENIKPSEGTEITPLDLEVSGAGENYEFGLDAPPVKFIRIKVLQTWGMTNFMYIMEMEIYGSKL